MPDWTPNNAEAINSGSLQIWFDASNVNGYILEETTTEDHLYGVANNISQINNLGTTGYYLSRAGSNYPTLRTGSLPGKNGFKFGNLAPGPGSWSSTVMKSNDANINRVRNNEDRIIFSVVSNAWVDGRGGNWKGIWGYGEFVTRNGFSVFIDRTGDIDTPILSFTFSEFNATPNNLLTDPPNKLIITAQNSSSLGNSQSLFFNTVQKVSATETLTTTVSSAENGFKLGSSNFANDSSDYVLHELLMYSVADSGEGVDNFRNIVEGYLAHKWSITDLLPAEHPYKSAAPQIGGEGGGSFPNPQQQVTSQRVSSKFVDQTLSQLPSQYDRATSNQSFVPLRLSVRGPSNLRLRPADKVYKVTKG